MGHLRYARLSEQAEDVRLTARLRVRRGRGKALLAPGRTGLRNIGNTCFVSAVCQVILRVGPLRAALEGHARRCPLAARQSAAARWWTARR